MTRILFVDDEPFVLEGLRMSLRRKRREWDMTFVEGAAAALAEIERQRPDVVVTDMRMPGMDGADLLARVAAIAPQITRIVLSGQMDDRAAARAANVAHRFIAKPCDSTDLESTITRGLELRKWLDSDVLSNMLGGLETLPSLPRAYTALGDALRNADVPIGAVASIIQTDVGMAAKVLQLVNSSFFGLSRNVVSIGQAVSYLGLQTMSSLVLAHSVFQQLPTKDVAAVERQQAHALVSARIARKLFPDARRRDVAETAALLHDVGLLALECRLPKEYAENRAEAKRQGVPLHVVERARQSVTHAEVGAYLLGLWGLPHEIIEAVAGHHGPWSDVTTLDTAAAVRIADALAAELFLTGDERVENGEAVPPEVLARLGLEAVVAGLRSELGAQHVRPGQTGR